MEMKCREAASPSPRWQVPAFSLCKVSRGSSRRPPTHPTPRGLRGQPLPPGPRQGITPIRQPPTGAPTSRHTPPALPPHLPACVSVFLQKRGGSG